MSTSNQNNKNNQNIRKMNDLISRISNKKNTSFKNQVKTFFSWSKSGQFLEILTRQLNKLLYFQSIEKLNEENIEKKFNQLLRITKRILQFEKKIEKKDENSQKNLKKKLEDILNSVYTQILGNFSATILGLTNTYCDEKTLGLYKYMQLMLIQLLKYSSHPNRQEYLKYMIQTKNEIDSFIAKKSVNNQQKIQKLWLEKVKMAQQEILGEP